MADSAKLNSKEYQSLEIFKGKLESFKNFLVPVVNYVSFHI